MQTVDLDLTTMEGLNEEVRRQLHALSKSMLEDDKASLTITINLKRIEDTDTLMDITYKVKPTFPSKSRKLVANTDLVGNLHVMASPMQRNVFNPKEEVTPHERA